MNYQPSLLLLTMLMISPITIAESYSNSQVPSLDFLEFLGEWQNSNGDWIDPSDLEDEDFIKLLEITVNEADASSTGTPVREKRQGGYSHD